jgi:hypothetical protein
MRSVPKDRLRGLHRQRSICAPTSRSSIRQEHAMNAATTHLLGPADFLRLPRRPVLLVAESGTVWVTEDGERADHQLDAGQQRAFDGHAPIMVGTLGGRGSVRVVPLDPPRRPLVRWLARAVGA